MNGDTVRSRLSRQAVECGTMRADNPFLDRRAWIIGAASAVAMPRGGAHAADATGNARMNVLSPPIETGVTLLSAPIELAGNWGQMIPNSGDLVVERMRRACLEGVRLVSDRQPTRLRVDEHSSGAPAVWLHPDGSTTAWVIVDIGQQAWSQLAYQFGHELGHVFANSWQPHDRPGGPTQWLEEALVESFSIRGLGKLAASWKQDPPFAGDNAYGDAIHSYREDILRQYRQLGVDQGGVEDPAAWYAKGRAAIEAGDGLNDHAKAAASVIVGVYETTPESVEGIGALNRWPGRARLPLADYLREWEASCVELEASPALPRFFAKRILATA
jgi:hypothetical protein